MSRPITIVDLRDMEGRLNRRIDTIAERLFGGMCPSCSSPYRNERREVRALDATIGELLDARTRNERCIHRWHQEVGT